MNSEAPIPKYSLFQRVKLLKLGIFKWNIPTYTTADELFILYDLAKSLETISIGVEIGSYTGASSLMIAKGLNKYSKLYCIDTWENDAMTEGNWNTYDVFSKNTQLVANKINTVKSNSTDAAIGFNKEIDFLFIDGDHSYDGVKADVDAWFVKLKRSGVIIMHDIGWAEGVIKVTKKKIIPNLSSFNQLPNMFWGWKK